MLTSGEADLCWKEGSLGEDEAKKLSCRLSRQDETTRFINAHLTTMENGCLPKFPVVETQN